MYKIAVLGDRASVLSFTAIGLSAYAVETAEQAREQLHRLAEEDYAVIYLTEQFAAPLAAELADYATRVSPAIILIPGREGSLGIGLENINKAVERAVGSNIL